MVVDPSASTDSDLERRASALIDVPEDGEVVFTRDRRRFVFVSTRDGLPGLYVGTSNAQAAPRRLANWSKRMIFPVITLDDQHVVFGSDEGGDEAFALYAAHLDTGAIERLTPRGLECEPPLLPSGKSGVMVYAGRVAGSPEATVYTGSTDGPGANRARYRDAVGGRLASVTSDAREAIFLRSKSHQSQEVVLVNLEDGRATLLYPRLGSATVHDAAFSADGLTVYVATDGGTEDGYLLSIDAVTGAEKARYKEERLPRASIVRLLAAASGTTLAARLDGGDHSEVRVLDAKTLALRSSPKLPLGIGEIDDLSPDGATLSVEWSTPDAPMSLVAVSTLDGALSPIDTSRPRLDVLGAMDVSSFTLKSFDGTPIPLVIARPHGSALPAATVVYLHGGPAGSADFRWSPWIRQLIDEGYALVAPNIRGSFGFGRAFEAADDGAKRGDSFRDIAAVRAWVAAQPWADPDRLAVAGASFGGYLVLHELTENPLAWRAGIDEFGIADLPSFMESTTGRVRANYTKEIGDPVRDRAFLEELSPLRNVDRIVAPLFVYAGANDPRVPRAQSEKIVSVMQSRHKTVYFMLGADEGHGAERRETRIALQARTLRFLNSYLRRRRGT